MKERDNDDHHAHEHLAGEELGHTLQERGDGEIFLALVLLDDFVDVDGNADQQQDDDGLGPHVRLKRIGVIFGHGRHRRLEHVRKVREHEEDEQQNVDNQFKQSASAPS